MRRCFMALLVVGLASLSACGGASNSTFAPRLAASNARPLIDEVYDFNLPPDAEDPWAGLLAGKNGEYYGTTTDGGDARKGAVYEITVAGKEKVLYSFQGQSDGASPRSTLIMDKQGALYGTTVAGGVSSHCKRGYGGCGTVFKLTPGKRGWKESVLFSFQGGKDDGAGPSGGLLMTKSGALLGTTSGGGLRWGAFRGGVIFELTPSGSSYSEKIVHTFSGPPDGLDPRASLASDSKGNLYGTTAWGGVIKLHCHKKFGYGGCGTVFKLTPSGSTYKYSVIYSFKGGLDGNHPSASLLLGPNGLFYGLTTEGGGVKPGGQGTVFSITTGGTERVLYRFNGTDGSDPDDTPGLVADRSGNLYGTTSFGGGAAGARRNTACSGGCGTVFKLTPGKDRWTESVLYAFQGASDGALPMGGVVIDSKGNLLGPTHIGGDHSYCACGTIFSVTP